MLQTGACLVTMTPESRGAPPAYFPVHWASDWGEDPVGLWQAFTYRGVRQAFRWCPPGRFIMGSPTTEYGRDNDEIQHEVILTRGFWLAETVCVKALWEAVTDKTPSPFKRAQMPVESVSWEDVQGFIDRLNAELPSLEAPRLGATDLAPRKGSADSSVSRPSSEELYFRLPTEAEWEYACRAGTTTAYFFGDDIDSDQANFDGRYPYRRTAQGRFRNDPLAVASLPTNHWGLYEMHGNVWEWCQDWYGDYPRDTVFDPAGPAIGEGRVLRGGGWLDAARRLRSAFRGRGAQSHGLGNIGFRLALGPRLRQAE